MSEWRVRTFWHDEEGQDLVEYVLLLAFVSLVAAAVYLGVSPLTGSLWSIANNRLASASN